MNLRARTAAFAALCAAGLVANLASASVPERPWLIRGRFVNMQSNGDSESFTNLSLTGAHVASDSGAEFDVSFFPHRLLAVELSTMVLQPNFNATGFGKGLGKIADASQFTPTLTVQWHPLPTRRVRPYLGLGVNYTTFYSEHPTLAYATAQGGPTSLSLSNSWGLVGQVGMDVQFLKNWVVNLDVKYLEADTRFSTVSQTAVGPVYDSAKVNENPFIFGCGVGYRF